MTVWVTSDTHFYHNNILKFNPDTRKHASIEDMNEFLIRDWNKKVQPNDTVYHLGDIAFTNSEKLFNLLNRLNGKLVLIKGNHDYKVLNEKVSSRFEHICDYLIINHNAKKVIAMHYPIQEWDSCHRGSIHIHGHCHGNLKQEDKKRVDVGVDGFLNGNAVETLDNVIKYADTFNVTSHH